MKELLEHGFKNVTYLLHSGIYVLCWKGQVVYVGQSSNPLERIGQHTRFIRFDAVYFIRCDRDALFSLEREFIERFKPSGNKPEAKIAVSGEHVSRDPVEKYKRFTRDGYDIHAGGFIEVAGVKIHVKKKTIR